MYFLKYIFPVFKHLYAKTERKYCVMLLWYF